MKIKYNHIPFLFFVTLLFSQENLPFKVGETLTYDAYFNLIKVGSATLSVVGTESIENTETYHFRFEVTTNYIADKIFSIRDRVDVWLHKKNFSTRKFIKKIEEGWTKVSYGATVQSKDSLLVTTQSKFPLTGLLHTPYSLFYYLRTIPLSLDNHFPVTVFDNDKFFDLTIEIKKKENIEVPAGSFNTVLVVPTKKDGNLFKRESYMSLWFTDDRRKIPVKIKLSSKIGEMTLKLKKLQPN